MRPPSEARPALKFEADCRGASAISSQFDTRVAVHRRVTVTAGHVLVIVSPSNTAENASVTPRRFADRSTSCPLRNPSTARPLLDKTVVFL